MGLFDSLLNSLKNEVKHSVRQGVNQAINQGVNQAIQNQKNQPSRTYSTFTFTQLPQALEEMKAMKEAGLHDPAAVACLVVMALNRYPEDRQACFDMMNFLKGPEPLSPMDQQKINNQFMDGKNYLMRSYFEGATPDNNYAPTMPYTLKPFENPYSRDNYSEGYIKIFLKSGGADTERYIVLRHKPSTDEWFINQFEGLLSGIRIPKAEDKWA